MPYRVQWNAMSRKSMKINAVRCDAMQCNTVKCDASEHPQNQNSWFSMVDHWCLYAGSEHVHHHHHPSQYTRMIDRCIPHHRCGGSISGWLDGAHPYFADGIVDRKVCFHGFYKCCYKNRKIRVRKCLGFYVYKLKASPGNSYVYCTI